MKRIIALVAVMATFACLANAATGSAEERTALLMVHFGTTHDDTRSATIDAINERAAREFAQMEVREAYTSRIVARRLAQRGIVKKTPLEALLQLRADGFRRVVVQPTHIIPGEEYATLQEDIAQVRHLFDDIQLGHPLLYTIDDCRRVADIMVAAGYAAPKNTHIVLVGHGTHHPANAYYAQTNYLLKQRDAHFHVATIEGFPALDDVLAELRQAKARRVVLVPFMFVAGDHAKNDIATEWKEALEKEGMQVEVRLDGLGQDADIQALFMQHIMDRQTDN